jgi:zinc transporter, ZIP family
VGWRLLRWLVAVTGLLAVTAALAIAQPWRSEATPDNVMVERATLSPGEIVLVLVNGSTAVARVAQVIVNDAYVDFRTDTRLVHPNRTGRVTVLYPWVEGESYEIELLMSPRGAIEYEIEEAEVGAQTPEVS